MAATIATTLTSHYVGSHPGANALSAGALTYGFSVAFYVLAGLAALGALVAAVFIQDEPAAEDPAGRRRRRSRGGRMSRFSELNDLVLQLKGLVLVRELQEKRGAEAEELGMYDAEIERVRDRLAAFVREGGGAERVAA